MNPADRIVTQIPLEQLWVDNCNLPATRRRSLDLDAVRQLLRIGPVQFVVADVGHPLKWIPPAERFEFWKRNGAPHFSDADQIRLNEIPNCIAYVASEWLAASEDVPIILLEKHH